MHSTTKTHPPISPDLKPPTGRSKIFSWAGDGWNAPWTIAQQTATDPLTTVLPILPMASAGVSFVSTTVGPLAMSSINRMVFASADALDLVDRRSNVEAVMGRLATTHGIDWASARKRLAAPMGPPATLRALRLAAGLSQTELAQRVGMAKSNLSRLENHAGDIQLSTLKRLANALNVSLGEVAAVFDKTAAEASDGA